MDRSEEDRAISEAVERLIKTFPDVSPVVVERAVADSRPEFEGNPIRAFVPLFVERAAKHRIRAQATASN
ncbi:three-helix bundle dimerization domain-containing protein [Kribbella sp. CWNU-51]